MDIKETPSTQEPTIVPKEFTPTMGQEIVIQRTSGHIEGGWKINYMNEDMLRVTKLDPYGKEIVRTVIRGNVERFNRLPKVEDIATSQNIQQLKFTVTKLGGVQGASVFFQANYILSCIDEVFKNGASEESLRKFTSNYGLRNTVRTLYSQNQKKDNQ